MGHGCHTIGIAGASPAMTRGARFVGAAPSDHRPPVVASSAHKKTSHAARRKHAMEQIDRRSFLRHTAATGAAIVAARGPAFAEEAVPNSSGTEAPRLKVPVGACDCHHH